MWVGVHAACMCVCVCVCEGEEEHCAAYTINSRVTLDYSCLYICVMLVYCMNAHTCSHTHITEWQWGNCSQTLPAHNLVLHLYVTMANKRKRTKRRKMDTSAHTPTFPSTKKCWRSILANLSIEQVSWFELVLHVCSIMTSWALRHSVHCYDFLFQIVSCSFWETEAADNRVNVPYYAKVSLRSIS